MADTETPKSGPITIKKYANRRLYNTATSAYVTLDHLAQMVKEGVEFVVYDAKTGEDITRSVLTQIIVEEESKGQNLLPIGFLRQLIGMYGDQMQWLVPQYLENAMDSFQRNQAQFETQFREAFGGMFPFGSLEEMSRQNVQMFERAMKMFNPLALEPKPGERPKDKAQPAAPGDRRVEDMQARLADLERQLSELAKRK